MKKTTLLGILLFPFALFSQAPTKSFTEKLEGITASKKELTKQASTDNSSIGQAGVMTNTVSLVTVSSRTMSFPIQLNYTAGIKVDQQSGPVGLGWVLPVGSIKRDFGAFYPDYSSTYHEADMYNTINEAGGQVLKGKFATTNGTVVNPFSNNQYLGFDAIENDDSRAQPLSDLYHISVPGKLSNSFYNSGFISTPNNPNKSHVWSLTEVENWKIAHIVKTYQIAQEFSRINEVNLFRDANNNMTKSTSYAAAIGVLPYVKNGFAKIPSGFSEDAFVPDEAERYVRYEDFEQFIITDENGTVYVFGRALRGQRYVYNDDPFWSNKHSQNVDDPAEGNFWKIDYIAEWLLTEIHSVDYVDSNGSHIADDGDAGDWIRFEYTDAEKVEASYLAGMCSIKQDQVVPKYREWSSFSQTDRASSLMHELAYLTKIVTPTQQIDFTISERYDVNHDYYTKPANRVGNDYYYENRKYCTEQGSITDFDIEYPVETMKYDSIKITSRLVNPELYPNESMKIGTIKFNYATKGSAQELAVSSYLIRNNNKLEKVVSGTLVGAPSKATPFDIQEYQNIGVDKRGKTTLLGLEFYGSTISAVEKNEYKFEYGYNPSFDEFHKREIIRAYYFPSLRQGSSQLNQPIEFSKADTPIQSNYPQVTYTTNGTVGSSNHSGVSPYDFLINFPCQEKWYTLDASTLEKTVYANAGNLTPAGYNLLSTSVTNPILPIQDVYGFFYIPGYAPSANAWSLTKITYPTGGEITFEYEPSSFTPSAEWNLKPDNFPIISNYNALAKVRSFVQDAHNTADATTYASLGMSAKKLTATYEVSLYTNYGIRLKKKTVSDRINPAVVTNYQYENGTFTAMPAEYVQSLISGFNQFISRENHRHQVENYHYFNPVFTYDFEERMSHLSQTNIALDDYTATNFYTGIKVLMADNSYIKKTYGPSYGTSIDFPVYNLFCYRLPSVSWGAGLVLAGDNINRTPISLKSEEYFETLANTPYQKIDYEYTRLTASTQSLNFKYNLSPGSNNFVNLWFVGCEFFTPDGTNGIKTYKPIDNLFITTTFNIGIQTPNLHSYTKWGQSKTVMSKEITNYKGIISETYHDYEQNVGTDWRFVLRGTRKLTINEPLSYITQYKYAFEEYTGITSKFTDLNLYALPCRTTSYLNSVAPANTLSAQVMTYDISLTVPKSLDTYAYETVPTNAATGTFTPTTFSTTDPNWRVSESDVYEYNPAAMPVSARSNQLYTKAVTGNGLNTLKANIIGTERPFDATYTGFEDFTDLKLIGEWNSQSYLKEDWFTTEIQSIETVTKTILTENGTSCVHNSSFSSGGSGSGTLYYAITTNDITNLSPGQAVTFSYTVGGTTTPVSLMIETVNPTIITDNNQALNYTVCFTTSPLPNINLIIADSKIVKTKVMPRLSNSYARTGKYSYKLASIRTAGEATKLTPVRPVRIAPLTIVPECNGSNVPTTCYWDYQTSLWIKYDSDIPPLNPPSIPSTPFSDDVAADAIYRRGDISTSTVTGVRIKCKVWNSSKTIVLNEYTFYPQDLNGAWKQYTIDFSVFKGPEQWVEVYVENTINQVGAGIINYKAAFVDDIIISPKDSKYEYTVTNHLGQQTFKVNNNDVFVQSTYDSKGRNATTRNPYGKVAQELAYFDQANWTTSNNYVTEVKWVANGLFNTTRYFMDGFGRVKQVQNSDHVRNMRAVSETNIYDNKGQITRSYKPYYLNQYGLNPSYDAGYAANTQTLYGSNFAYTDIGFEPKPEPVVSSVYAPKSNAENVIVSSQQEYMNTTALSHISIYGSTTFPTGTLLVHETTNPLGKVTRTYLNRLGQVIMEEHQIGMDYNQNTDGSISFNTYDLGFAQTWFYYDGAGRIVETYDPENKRSSYFYNSLGVMVKTISPDKGISELRYDKYGQVRFIRNQKDIDAATGNIFATSQFKYIKYDKWGQNLESGVVTVAPNDLDNNPANPGFPTGDFFNDYTKINDQNYPQSTDKFVQVHIKNNYNGTRKFYTSTALTNQITYSQHTLSPSTYLYTPAKTDQITKSYMADGQGAKTSFLYDGLAGTHQIVTAYNEMNLPIGKDYTNSVNSGSNFKWRTAIDIHGRAVTNTNTYNATDQQVSKNYYDPLGNLLLVGLGTTGNTSDPHRDYVSIKKNIREQLISQMSKNYRVGLTYDAAGNITNQYWSNEKFEPATASSTKINQYAYTYDKMNRLIGADYKQSTMTSNPFTYFATLNANIPGDFICTLDGEVVASAFQPHFDEFEHNIDANADVTRSTNSIAALNELQSDYMLNNKQYSEMSTTEIDDFFTHYLANCNIHRLTPTDFEYYEAAKANDATHIAYLNGNRTNTLSFKYMRILLGTIPWTAPVNCMPNPNATAYGYLQNFPTPTAASNSTNFDEAFWYQENGNFYTLNRNNNTGQKTQQLYSYQSGTNKLTQASFQFTTGTPDVYNYTYDGNGNLLTDPKNAISSIAYSLFDELPVSITNTSGQHNYRYFGGTRSVKEISATDREYYIDDVILDQNGTVKSYQTAAGYATQGGTTASYFYQVKDWLGSMHITMSSNGTVLNAMDYYSYGKAMPTRNTFASNQEGYRYLFTGHEKDGETSYQYHGARYYDEDLARYMSVDRFAMKFFHQSPYVYAGNNPINNVDINGDYSEEVAKGMAERGGDNGYTTRVVANPNKEGDFGVSFTRVRNEGTYRKTQYDGKFTGIGKSGLTRNKDAFMGNLSARLNSPEGQSYRNAVDKQNTNRNAAIQADNVAPAGIQSVGTGRASDGRYYNGCMSCHSQVGAYADDMGRLGWHEAGMASFQAGMFLGSIPLSLPGAAIGASAEAGIIAEEGATGGIEAIEMGQYNITKTVANNLPTRPYINSPSTITNIMKSGNGTPDAFFKGGMNWKVPGAFNGSNGIFELGMNPQSRTIYHFLFKTLKP
nr:RHS repeat-associated core domain-containing protein [uncultured Fluviicola sp.]